MTHYDTPYNRSLARSQRLYDYADIKQDEQDIYNSQPLNGGLVDGGYSGGALPADIAEEIPENRIVGGTMRGAEMADVLAPSGRKDIMRPAIQNRVAKTGGRRHMKKRGYGEGDVKGGEKDDSDSDSERKVGGDFFNDLISTVGNVAQTAAHILPLFGMGEPSGGAKGKRKVKLSKAQMEKLLMAIALRDKKRGRGLSGGDQIMDTDHPALTGAITGNMGSSGKHNMNTNAVMGNGQVSGGIDFGALFRKIDNRTQGMAQRGLDLARKGCDYIGQGEPSGGANLTDIASALWNSLDDDEEVKQAEKVLKYKKLGPWSSYSGSGAGRYDMPELLGMDGGMYNKAAYGMGQPSGGGVISDLGIPGISQLAGLFGLGQPSGGGQGAISGGADEDEIIKSFLGGRMPSEVPKEEKQMLMRKALADAQLANEVKTAMERMKSGQGLSGGNLPMMERMVGGDFFNDLVSTIGNVAQTAAHVLPLFGLGQPSGGSAYGQLGRRLAGGAIEDGMPFNSPPPSYYPSNTPITGGRLPPNGVSSPYDMEDLQRAVALSNLASQGSGMSGGRRLLLKPQMRGSTMSGFGQPSGGDQADLDYQPMEQEIETSGSSGDKKERGDTKGGKKPRGSSSRNAIVAKVMREKGMKLVEASKYVKAHNLYKGK